MPSFRRLASNFGAIGVVLVLLLAVTFLPPDNSLHEVQTQGSINACVPTSYPPLVTGDPSQPGIDVELLKAVTAKMGVTVNCVGPAAATRITGTMPGAPAVIEPDEVPEDEWNRMDPAVSSPLVAWLCSDLARDVSGQVFAVSGKRIQLIQGFHPVTELPYGEADWTIERIEAGRATLLGGRPAGVPPFMPGVGD